MTSRLLALAFKSFRVLKNQHCSKELNFQKMNFSKNLSAKKNYSFEKISNHSNIRNTSSLQSNLRFNSRNFSTIIKNDLTQEKEFTLLRLTPMNETYQIAINDKALTFLHLVMMF